MYFTYRRWRGTVDPVSGDGAMIKPSYLHHWAVSDPADIQWDEDGSTVDVHFLAQDGTAIVLSMPAKILRHLGDRIADAHTVRSQGPIAAGTGNCIGHPMLPNFAGPGCHGAAK